MLLVFNYPRTQSTVVRCPLPLARSLYSQLITAAVEKCCFNKQQKILSKSLMFTNGVNASH